MLVGEVVTLPTNSSAQALAHRLEPGLWDPAAGVVSRKPMPSCRLDAASRGGGDIV
jgi:hypothetical protein